MKIIVPMAGIGKRMRPHTLTIPKPLLPVAGKPIVQRLVEDIAGICKDSIDEIAFVIGVFGKEVELQLKTIANNIGAKGSIFYQKEALGTAHAILCAKEVLKGKIIVAFADTLFKADFTLDENKDGIIWVHKVANPSSFGVVKINGSNIITDFIEKPPTFVSDLAIIGIYYFKDGEYLKNEMQYLIDNDIKEKGEYQLTNALENMKRKGIQFVSGAVQEWLDCGNKDATVYTNQRILELNQKYCQQNRSVQNQNSLIIEPCFIGKNVRLVHSVIGPHVSINDDSSIENSCISNSIIQSHTKIHHANIHNSMIGNHVEYFGNCKEVSIGDYTTEINGQLSKI